MNEEVREHFKQESHNGWTLPASGRSDRSRANAPQTLPDPRGPGWGTRAEKVPQLVGGRGHEAGNNQGHHFGYPKGRAPASCIPVGSPAQG